MNHDMTLNVYPDSNVLSRALADLLVDYSWKSFTMLYDTDEGMFPQITAISRLLLRIDNYSTDASQGHSANP